MAIEKKYLRRKGSDNRSFDLFRRRWTRIAQIGHNVLDTERGQEGKGKKILSRLERSMKPGDYKELMASLNRMKEEYSKKLFDQMIGRGSRKFNMADMDLSAELAGNAIRIAHKKSRYRKAIDEAVSGRFNRITRQSEKYGKFVPLYPLFQDLKIRFEQRNERVGRRFFEDDAETSPLHNKLRKIMKPEDYDDLVNSYYKGFGEYKLHQKFGIPVKFYGREMSADEGLKRLYRDLGYNVSDIFRKHQDFVNYNKKK